MSRGGSAAGGVPEANRVMSTHTAPQTLVDKIWNRHVIRELSDGRTLLHIDRHFLH